MWQKIKRWREVHMILCNTLHVLLGHKSKGNVMQEVMANLEALDFIPKSTSEQVSLIMV